MKLENTTLLVRRVRIAAVLGSLAKHGLYLLCITGGWLILLSIFDAMVHLPLQLRRSFYYGSAFAAAALSCRWFLLNRRRYLSDERLVLFIQSKIPALGDRLVSAWQLSKGVPQGTSEAMALAHAVQVEKDVKGRKAGEIVPVYDNLKKPLGYAAVVFALIAAAQLFPAEGLPASFKRIVLSCSSSEWYRWFTVTPGNAKIAWSSDATVLVMAREPVPGVPHLRLRTGKDEWKKIELEKLPDGGYGAQIRQVTVKTEYGVVWNDWETPLYTLTPAMPVRLGDFSVTYYYPRYTALPAQTVEGNPALSGLPGTRVRIDAKANRSLRSIAIETDYGDRYPVQVDGMAISAQFVLRKEGSYRFLITDEEGIAEEPADYPVTLMEDRPPAVELLSPVDDLVVAPKSEVPLVARIEDDFGLSSVDLVYRIAEGDEKRVHIERSFSGTRQATVEYQFNLARLSLRPGEKLRYFLEAWDNNTVSGPRSSVTRTMVLEAMDYQKEHDAVESDLKEMRQKLLNVLADQMVVREETKALSIQFSTAAFREALLGQQSVKNELDVPLRQMDSLLERMEADPLTDFSTLSEYKGIQSHLAQVRNRQMEDAGKSLSARNFDAAGRKQDEIIANLEKLSLLTEDVWQYQRMRDLMDTGSELEKTGRDLVKQLGEGADAAGLKKALSSVRELMDKISAQLAKLPHELPEDFVNSPAMKQLNMQGAKDLAAQLGQAIDKGDLKKARELADRLAADLQALLRTMEGAGDEVGFSKASSERQKQEVERIAGELERVVQRQEELSSGIGAIDEAARKQLFRKQEALLPALAERQQKLIERAERAVTLAGGKAPQYLWTGQQSLGTMRKVLEEFRQRRVFHSQKYLEDILRQWEESDGMLIQGKARLGEEVYTALHTEVRSITAGENEILTELKKPRADGLFSPSDEEKMRSLGGEENALSDRTQKLKRSLDEFMRQSAAVGPESFEDMEKAADEMRNAGKELSSGNPSAAAESSRRALDYLRAGREGLSAAGEGMSGRGEKSGRPVPAIKVRSGTGSTGFRSAPVKLPRADEYKVPAEFRQEILDGMKEKYPLQYEKIIKEYYHRLVK